MNINEYCQRIGYQNEVVVNEDCLKELHRYHVMSIPFEAIDVQLGRRIELKLDSIFHKVVKQNRGGYCYELNLLFQAMLSEIGFESYLISARIFNNQEFGPEFDHMAIVVKLQEYWLVDVGYGDLFIEPILLKVDYPQEDKFKTYKIENFGSNGFVLKESLKGKSEFILKYQFSNIPRTIDEFEAQNNWKQTSKDSYFVKNMICTLPTQNGRYSILNTIYKVRIGTAVKEIEIKGKTKMKEILNSHFNIKIE